MLSFFRGAFVSFAFGVAWTLLVHSKFAGHIQTPAVCALQWMGLGAIHIDMDTSELNKTSL